MATIEQQQKSARDLRRIDNAAQRLIQAYADQLETVLRQMDRTEPGEKRKELRRRADSLQAYLRRLEQLQDDVRSMGEWVELDLRA